MDTNLVKKLSTLVVNQLPEFLRVDTSDPTADNTYQTFVTFLQAYYEFLEQNGEAQYVIQNARSYADIDQTIDSFVDKFLQEFAYDLPKTIFSDQNPNDFNILFSGIDQTESKRAVAKRISQIYASKGSEAAIRLLFRLLFDDEITFYYPKEDMLRTSDGRWNERTTIKIYVPGGNVNFSQYEANLITGVSSSASAVVDRVTGLGFEAVGKDIYELELEKNSISGVFRGNETIQFSVGNLTTGNVEITGNAVVINVISGFDIVDSGYGYTVGTSITVTDTGNSFAASVGAVNDGGKILRISIANFGADYAAANASIALPTTVRNGRYRLESNVVTAVLIDGTGNVVNHGLSANDIIDVTFTSNLISITWDISAASYLQNFSVAAQETTPNGIFFKPDGSKMYIVGFAGDDVNEYDLSSAWDISTASYLQNFSVAAQEIGPTGLFFKPDGSKMYIVGGAGQDVNEYNLGSAWDISTATFLQNFSVAAQEISPTGLFFKPDGSKMYIVGELGDDVNEYNLGSAWDISTATFLQNFSVAAQETTLTDIFFKPDGTKMYILGDTGNDVNEYDLSIAWDIDTASYLQNFSVAAQEISPKGLFFKPDGTKMYIVGSAGDDVNEYNIGSVNYDTVYTVFSVPSSKKFRFAVSNTNTIVGNLSLNSRQATLTPNIGTLCNYYGIYTGKEGQTNEKIKIQDSYYYQDYSYVIRTTQSSIFWKDLVKKILHPAGMELFGEVFVTVTGDTVQTVYAGITNVYDTFIQLIKLISESTFVRIPTAVSTLAVLSISQQASRDSRYRIGPTLQTIDFFKFDYDNLQIKDIEDIVIGFIDEPYNIPPPSFISIRIAWDISTATFLQTFSVAAQDTFPQGLFFKPDGTKMYIVGATGEDVNEYDLSSAWDISTASYLQNFSVAAQETNPSDIFFKPDGSKMYVLGDTGNDVNEYDLSSAWDISTASYLQNFSVAAEDITPQGIFFKPDGTKMYILGIQGVDVNEYNLGSAWDISTASYLQNFSVFAQEGTPSDIFFKPDGTKMYILGVIGDDVNEYNLSSAWDISTATFLQNFSVAAQDVTPTDIFFKPDGTKMYIVGSAGNDVNEYDLV